MAQRGEFFARPWDSQPQEAAGVNLQSPLANGLEACYGVDLGRPNLIDATGNYPGTVTLPSQVATDKGMLWNGARGMSGASAGVYAKAAAGQPQSFAFWVRPSASDTSLDAICGLGDGLSLGKVTQFVLYTNVVAARDVYLGFSDCDFYTAGAQFTAGSWVHIAATYTGGGPRNNTKIYVNGVDAATTKVGAFLDTTAVLRSRAVVIGRDPGTAGREFRGIIGPGGIWSRALPPAEIAQHRDNPWQIFAPRRIWVPVSAAAGGGATAALDATLGAATTTATGALLISAASAQTLAAAASAATSTLALAATTSATLAAATTAATAALQIKASAAPTLEAATSSAAGVSTPLTLAALSVTLAAATTAATGTLSTKATAAPTLAAVTSAATGRADIAAALGITLGDLVVSSASQLRIAAAASPTLAAATSLATGVLASAGVPTLSAATVFNITSTTVTPRVTITF